MMHSFFRLVLAWLGLYRVDLGARYYYAMSGPFSDERIYPLDSRQGFVQYGVEYADGAKVVTWTSTSTFAIMCRKHRK